MKRTTIVWGIAMLYCILFGYTVSAKLVKDEVAKEKIYLTPHLTPVASEITIILLENKPMAP